MAVCDQAAQLLHADDCLMCTVPDHFCWHMLPVGWSVRLHATRLLRKEASDGLPQAAPSACFAEHNVVLRLQGDKWCDTQLDHNDEQQLVMRRAAGQVQQVTWPGNLVSCLFVAVPLLTALVCSATTRLFI